MKVERRHLPPVRKFSRMSPATSTPALSNSVAHRLATNSATWVSTFRRRPMRHTSNWLGSDQDSWRRLAGSAEGTNDNAPGLATEAPLEISARHQFERLRLMRRYPLITKTNTPAWPRPGSVHNIKV